MKHLLLIGCCLLAICGGNKSQNVGENCRKHKCRAGSDDVDIFGQVFKCPEGFTCNTGCFDNLPVFIPKEVDKTSHQLYYDRNSPCAPVNVICPYECSRFDRSLVWHGNMTLQCPSGTECNTEKTSCRMCVPKKCPKPSFECEDEKHLTYKGVYRATCPEKAICNKDNVYPCSPCIGEEGSGELSGNWLLRPAE